MADEKRYREAERRLWDSLGVDPAEHRLHLRRNDVDVRVQEVGDGPPVVFVHGASNSGSSWSGLAARLPQFRCILVDRPGCGLSAPLGRTLDVELLREHAETLVIDVLDALELQSADLVATSFGGYTAMRTAAAHPQRVRRVVHFGWLVGAPVARLSPFMRLAGVRWLAHLGTAMKPNERMIRSMLTRIGLRNALATGAMSQVHIDAFLALMRDTDTMRNELRTGAGRFLSFRGLDERLILPDSLLESITQPVYFLWGEDDPFGGADVAAQVVDRIPNAELELMPGAGHAVWMDDAAHAAHVTARFFGQ